MPLKNLTGGLASLSNLPRESQGGIIDGDANDCGFASYNMYLLYYFLLK